MPFTQRPSSKYAIQCASAHTDGGGAQNVGAPPSTVGSRPHAGVGAGTSGGVSFCCTTRVQAVRPHNKIALNARMSVMRVGQRTSLVRIAATRCRIAARRSAVVEAGHPNTLASDAGAVVIVGLPIGVGADCARQWARGCWVSACVHQVTRACQLGRHGHTRGRRMRGNDGGEGRRRRIVRHVRRAGVGHRPHS